MSNVVVIAGGTWQAPIVRYLKAKGHKVYIVNPIPTETTALADVHICEDVRNVESILGHLRGVSVEFVTSDQSDVAVIPIAMLSEKLGTVGNSVYQTLPFTNKIWMWASATSWGI